MAVYSVVLERLGWASAFHLSQRTCNQNNYLTLKNELAMLCTPLISERETWTIARFCCPLADDAFADELNAL